MNAQANLFLNANQVVKAANLVACLSACGLLGGCVGDPFERAKVDPRSPVAAEVALAARTPAAFPKFADIPPVPKDIRPKPQFGKAAAQTELAAAQIERATAPDTWTLQQTDAFAGAARKAVGPDVAPADSTATEAFAKDLRKRATPPPPPKR